MYVCYKKFCLQILIVKEKNQPSFHCFFKEQSLFLVDTLAIKPRSEFFAVVVSHVHRLTVVVSCLSL